MENIALNAGIIRCTPTKILGINAMRVSINLARIESKKILNCFITLAWKFLKIKLLKIWDGVTIKSEIIA
jgi:hypothetical protein